VIQAILDDLPYTLKARAKKAVEKYEAEKRKPITTDLILRYLEKIKNEKLADKLPKTRVESDEVD
jgi:hypothetical protein